MNTLAAIVIALHILSAIIWVGGMFFAYMVLRPVAGSVLDAPQPLVLWNGVFKKFFLWVWKAVVLLLGTGYYLIFVVYGGFGLVGVHVHIMHGLGLLMAGIFAFLFFFPYARFRAAVSTSDWATAAGHLGTIRKIVAVNLVLGLLTSAVAAGGRFLG